MHVRICGCALRAAGKKSCSFALYFRNDSLPLVGTFHSECVMLLSFSSSSSSCIHPPPHIPIPAAPCVTSAPCAAEQHFGFYGSCCSHWTHGLGGRGGKKMLKVAKFRCRMSILSWSEGWDVLGEAVPRAGPRTIQDHHLPSPEKSACRSAVK